MTVREPTPFQQEAMERLRHALYAVHSVPSAEGDWIDGNEESYWKLRWAGGSELIEAYIYADEAGIMRHGTDWTAFEAPDFRSSTDLISGFLNTLTGMLRDSFEAKGRAIEANFN
jgi:hypothetical protein